MKKAILSIAYLPPVQYFSKLASYDEIIIEADEHYSKQSYRNRCHILSPNGVQCLSIPIKRKNRREISIKEIEIDNSEKWQLNHKRSIITAYRSAPYFDFYFDELLPFFDNPAQNLFDFNLALTKKLCELLNIKNQISLNTNYQAITDADDFRESIHPKKRMQKPDEDFIIKPYMQVFMEKFNFVENLSILDLLMNEGSLSCTYLNKA